MIWLRNTDAVLQEMKTWVYGTDKFVQTDRGFTQPARLLSCRHREHTQTPQLVWGVSLAKESSQHEATVLASGTISVDNSVFVCLESFVFKKQRMLLCEHLRPHRADVSCVSVLLLCSPNWLDHCGSKIFIFLCFKLSGIHWCMCLVFFAFKLFSLNAAVCSCYRVIIWVFLECHYPKIKVWFSFFLSNSIINMQR